MSGQELHVSPATCRNYPPATARLKLRNSCHGCALSKLKCSQEKPTCSRCAKRGISCQYLAAKPGGRKPNRQSNGSQSHPSDPKLRVLSSTDPDAHLPLLSDWFGTAPASNASIDPLPSPGTLHHSSSKAGFSETPSNAIQDLFGSGTMEPIPTSTVSTTATTQIDFGDYFSTTPPLFSEEMTTLDCLGAAQILSTGIDNSNNISQGGHLDSLSSYRDAVSELFSVSTPSPMPTTETISTSSIEISQSCEGSRTIESLDHSCLIQALQSMETITLVSCHQGPLGIASIRAILARNKDALNAVGAMVKCGCSEDGYLLAIVSLIIFKVLDGYAAIARQGPNLKQDIASHKPPPSSRSSSTVSLCTSSSDHNRSNPVVVGKYYFNGTDSARMAAQLVLSELYLVRRLVEQLSIKLKEHGEGNGRKKDDTTATALETASETSNSDSEKPSPLSRATYDHLGIALAERLRSLSLNTIDLLRKI